jgi:regulator of RNase E activity RraA
MRRLLQTELSQWQRIPTAVLSDERQHRGVLNFVRPLFAGRPFAGQAFTIQVGDMHADPPRKALTETWPGACIVIDARATPDAAVWGGKLIGIARERGIAAIVVDGSVRDSADLRGSGIAVCSRGITPRGPNWAGRYGVPIQCGGVDIAPGDLVVGDDDGVVAVPLAEVNEALLARCRTRLARDAEGNNA